MILTLKDCSKSGANMIHLITPFPQNAHLQKKPSINIRLSALPNPIFRPLYNDHNKMKALVKSGEILEEVEKVVGELR